jgi:hypothetical protein
MCHYIRNTALKEKYYTSHTYPDNGNTTGLQNNGFYFNFDNKADHLKFYSTYTLFLIAIFLFCITIFVTLLQNTKSALHWISYNKLYNKVIIYTSVEDLFTQTIPNT